MYHAANIIRIQFPEYALKIKLTFLFELPDFKYEVDDKIAINTLEFNLISVFLDSLLLPGNNSMVFSAGIYAFFKFIPARKDKTKFKNVYL
jgi:hypothetical protein